VIQYPFGNPAAVREIPRFVSQPGENRAILPTRHALPEQLPCSHAQRIAAAAAPPFPHLWEHTGDNFANRPRWLQLFSDKGVENIQKIRVAVGRSSDSAIELPATK
jgi:hypothetical protein